VHLVTLVPFLLDDHDYDIPASGVGLLDERESWLA